MNAPSLLRIIGGVTLVVVSAIGSKLLIDEGRKVVAMKKQYQDLDIALDKQEQELEELRKTRESLL